MASTSDHRAHAALQPADCLILLPQRLPAAVETSIGPAHYPAECTQSDAFLQPSLRARKGRANSNSFFLRPGGIIVLQENNLGSTAETFREMIETARLSIVLVDGCAPQRNMDRSVRVPTGRTAPHANSIE